jgi:hypothetical protein
LEIGELLYDIVKTGGGSQVGRIVLEHLEMVILCEELGVFIDSCVPETLGFTGNVEIGEFAAGVIFGETAATDILRETHEVDVLEIEETLLIERGAIFEDFGSDERNVKMDAVVSEKGIF